MYSLFLKGINYFLGIGLLNFISFFFSAGSLLIAIKAYRLSKKNAKLEEPHLFFYMISKSIRKFNNRSIYWFIVNISNSSKTNNSIKDVKLKIYYTVGNETRSIQLSHEEYLQNNKDVEASGLPIHIDAGSSTNVKLAYRMPEDIKKLKNIDYYALIFTDTYNNSNKIDIAILCEEDDFEKELE